MRVAKDRRLGAEAFGVKVATGCSALLPDKRGRLITRDNEVNIAVAVKSLDDRQAKDT